MSSRFQCSTPLKLSLAIRILFVLSGFILSTNLRAQFTYQLDQSIPVSKGDREMAFPWAGGLNTPQFNTLDLNGDNKPDLALFDRAAGKILTFLNINNTWNYHPEFEFLFPKEVSQWMLLRDFNCDGKKDIFTSDPFGIAVFVNTTKPGEALSWRPYNPGFPLLTEGFSGNVNLKVNDTDIPAIDDIDGDGDLDVLNLKFVGAGTVEYHKNFAMERTGKCDSIQLVRVTQNYGGFEECSCGKFAFGQTCVQLGGGRTAHAGGKTLLTLDMDNDGDREILFSEETCARVYLLMNDGTKDNAVMTSAVSFPTQAPIAMLIFPATFLEDVDFDGKADLLSSPNVYSRTSLNNSFQTSVWYYKNTGTTELPAFTFMEEDFLQRDMIDVGDYAYPAFADADNDGDLDMFISNYADESFNSTITFFENTGSVSQPAFRLITYDYAGISTLEQYNLKIQFADVSGDGNLDLVMTGTGARNGRTGVYYLPNLSKEGLSFSIQNLQTTEFRIDFGENILVTDVDRDGLWDILVGTTEGAVEFWKNNGPDGVFNLSLQNATFLGLAPSTTRQNLALSVEDLDADGRADLITGDQRGTITIYGDFRSENTPIGIAEVIQNSFAQTYETKNLGGRIAPVAVNIFNTNKPALAVGTVAGGVYLLKNDNGEQLPPVPEIAIYPNPVLPTETLNVKPDRNVLMQVFTLLGQKASEEFFIPANQVYPFTLQGLAPGLYIARFTVNSKIYGQKFIVR